LTAGSHKLRLEFEFIGTIHSVSVDVSGELIKDEEAEIRQIMARQ